MFPKLVVVVLTIGACACTLLSIRQARLQAAHELARAQLRVHEADDHLWAVRAEIGRRVVPAHVRQMAEALGSFRPMLPLPGDVDRRSMYAQGSQPHADPEQPVKLDQKPKPSPQAEVRTVSQTQTKSKPKTDAKPDPKSESKPDTKKSVAKTDSKSADSKSADSKSKAKPTRQATAIRREPGT